MPTNIYLFMLKQQNINIAQYEQYAEQMTTTKIKITVGNTTVEIEAPLEGLEEAVRNVLSALRTEPPAQQSKPQQSRRPMTCRAVVQELVENGWMSAGRTLSEVVAELERRGYIYDSTAVAHVLLDLVRSGVLERVGEPRRYVYREAVQRKLSQPVPDDSARDVRPSDVMA